MLYRHRWVSWVSPLLFHIFAHRWKNIFYDLRCSEKFDRNHLASGNYCLKAAIALDIYFLRFKICLNSASHSTAERAIWHESVRESWRGCELACYMSLQTSYQNERIFSFFTIILTNLVCTRDWYISHRNWVLYKTKWERWGNFLLQFTLVYIGPYLDRVGTKVLWFVRNQPVTVPIKWTDFYELLKLYHK